MRLAKPYAWLLLINLCFFAGVFAYLQRQPNPVEDQPATTPETVIEQQPGTERTLVEVVTNQLQWAQLEAEDYPTYIARLRSIGCPEQTIRDIIIADLEKLYAPKVQSIYGRRPVVRYWESEEEELANNFDHSDWLRRQRELDSEKRRLVQELVGVDLVRERLKQRGYEDYYERRLAFVPEEKRGALRTLLEKYEEREQALREAAIDAEGVAVVDPASLNELNAARDAELAQLLTPAEQRQMELWLSPTANSVRYSMYGMNPTEQEFLLVYNLRKDFDRKWDSVDLQTAPDATLLQWQQDREAVDERVRAELGEARFAEFKRGSDPDFHQLNAAVSRFHLPREKAIEAYEIKRSVKQMTATVRADPTLPQQVREQALYQIAQESDRSMAQLLGNAAYRHFRQHSQANWLE